MQGRDLIRPERAGPAGAFALGMAISSSLFFTLLWWVGEFVRAAVDDEVRALTALVAAVALMAVDVHANHLGRWESTGPRRQTPRRLMYLTGATRVGFVWGLDIGTHVTTFRMTTGVWFLAILALLGYSAPWVGLVVTLTFIVPLLGQLRDRGRAGADVMDTVCSRAVDGRLTAIRWTAIGLTAVTGIAVIGVSWGG